MAKEKEEKKISVEMTESQKEKVVAILAEPETPKEEKAQVTLRFAHFRNGVQYGPGMVIVDNAIASSLYVKDQEAYRSLLSQADSKLVRITMQQSGLAKIEEGIVDQVESGIKKL